jgi:hypothetical protein
MCRQVVGGPTDRHQRARAVDAETDTIVAKDLRDNLSGHWTIIAIAPLIQVR